MKITIDSLDKTLTTEIEGKVKMIYLYSKEALEIISHQWLKVGWNQKYTYTFTWMGRPVIQLPEDMIRVQEVIYRLRPDVIIETGVAHGGSLIYYASLCKIIGKGRVVGVDVEIRPHNRKAIQSHELSSYISLIEGSSTDKVIVSQVESMIKPAEVVMVILDSNHSKRHVKDELDAYCNLVTPGSYFVATDGIMKDLLDVPRSGSDWDWNNPAAAVAEFVKEHPEFALEQPNWLFNESNLTENVTHWPGAWLKKR